jgi:putative transposase
VYHKRVYRLCRNDGQSLRLKTCHHNLSAANRDRHPAAVAANETWSMDSVSDALFDGRRLRALTVVDAFTREALTIDVDQCIKGEQVAEVMARISSIPGARRNPGGQGVGVRLEGARPLGFRERRHAGLQAARKADRQRLLESFNGRLRDECLNTHWFLSMEGARATIEPWRRDYNESRPHTSPG